MAITIDASVGGISSNSYITLVEANTYMEAVPWFASTWDGLTDAVKNSWLVFSTRSIDRMKFQASRYDTDQALEFPRTITDDQTDEGDMPQKVKDAQCEMIIYLYNHMSTDDGSPEREIEALGVGRGALNIKFKLSERPEYNLVGGYSDAVRSLLREWLLSQNNIQILRG